MTSPNPSRLDLLHGHRLKNTICIPGREEYILKPENDLPGTSITLRQMFIIVGGICMGLTIIISIFNFLSYLIWRSKLQEQKQLMRLIILPVLFTVFSWCSIVIYGLGNYLDPIPKLYEVYCVACFHNLMIQVLPPDESTREEFFVSTERLDRKNKKQKHVNGSYRWYRVQSMLVHNSLFVIAVLTIIEEVLVYKECKTNEADKVASMIITLLTTLFTIMAVLSLLQIYTPYKAEHQGTRVLRRFWTVKGFVFLYLIQSIIIAILKATGAVSQTKYMTMSDFEYGRFVFLLCVEGFFFALLSVWSISALPYRANRLPAQSKVLRTGTGPDAGVFKYFFNFLFPKEVFVGFGLALQTLFKLRLGRKRYDHTAGTGVGWKERQASSAYQPLTNATAHKEDHDDDTGYQGT